MQPIYYASYVYSDQGIQTNTVGTWQGVMQIRFILIIMIL